jgi:tRNA G10  N-methylase Trm11
MVEPLETIKDAYPLSDIESMLSRLAEARVFSNWISHMGTGKMEWRKEAVNTQPLHRKQVSSIQSISYRSLKCMCNLSTFNG